MYRLLEVEEIIKAGDQEHLFNHEFEEYGWYEVTELNVGDTIESDDDIPVRRKMTDKTIGKIVKANQDLVIALKEIHDEADHIIGSDRPISVFLEDAHSIRNTAKKALKDFHDNLA